MLKILCTVSVNTLNSHHPKDLVSPPSLSSPLLTPHSHLSLLSIFMHQWGMNGWMEGEAWTAPGGDYDKVNI